MTTTTRPAAVAGTFYPADPAALARDVAALLDRAGAPIEPGEPTPKAIIAPHAGYIYSGPVAATVYARLAPLAPRIRRVVLLGPAHRVALRGLALPGAAAFDTPLGTVPVAAEANALLQDLPQVVVNRDAHALEHSLEVHLPFLQKALGDFELIPLVVGHATTEDVAQVLERLWDGEETLVVVSSDLSHYLGYAQAQATDRDTARLILNRQPILDPYQACGAIPANGLLTVAARRGLGARLLDLRNSGDTAGDRSRVVGYGSFAFYPDTAAAGDTPGDVMIPIARAAIGGMFGLALRAHEDHAFLHARGACFVTLTRHGRLRGCIGSLHPHRKLLDDIKANAKAAAFLDPRFEPLTATEFKSTLVEISLLSAAEPITFADQADAIARLRPGIDGVILECDGKRSTFLPPVWEQMPDPREFLAYLKRKAGLPPDFWSDDVRLSRYTVNKWKEAELPGAKAWSAND